MGHKAHPIGLRLGIHRNWKSNWFFQSKNYTKFMHLNLDIEKFFEGFLYFYGIKSLLLNCQIVKMPSNRLFVFVYYYRFRKKTTKRNYSWKTKLWKTSLEKHFNKKNAQIYSRPEIFIKKKNTDFNILLKTILTNNTYKDIPQTFNLKKPSTFKNFYNQILKNVIQIKNLNLILKIIKFLKLNKITKNILLSNIKSQIFNLRFKNLFLILLTKQTPQRLKIENIISCFKTLKQLKIYLKCISNINQKNKLQIFCIKKTIKFLEIKFRKILHLKRWFYRYLTKKNNLTQIRQKSTKTLTKKYLFNNKNVHFSTASAKQFLSRLTNSKINLILINTLSFAKFFYLIEDTQKKDKKGKYNILQIQKIMLNKYKYNAIFIKDFVHLAFISILLKNTTCLVKFMGEQFKRLPKNRKQMKLLNFIQQTLKIFCQQRKEFIGFKLQIQGRLNRRNRTHKWTFQNGNLPIQTYETRVEYGYSEGWTRSGLIGIKLWFFYSAFFKKILKLKILQYLYYSKYKNSLIQKTSFQRKPYANQKQSWLSNVPKQINPKRTQFKKKFNKTTHVINNPIKNTSKQNFKSNSQSQIQKNAKTKSTKISKK